MKYSEFQILLEKHYRDNYNLSSYLKGEKCFVKDIEVGRDLDLRYTPTQSLPEGLKVGGYLNLYNTSIQSLPERLEVGGEIFGLNQ